MKSQRRKSAIMMLNSTNYLNSIAMKYRFEQMRMNNIVQKINRKAQRRKRNNLLERIRNSFDDSEGKAKENDIHCKNLFERLQHKGSVLDSDIRKGQKILADIKQKRVIEGDEQYAYEVSEDSDEDSYAKEEANEKRKEKIDEIIRKNKRNEKKVEFLHLKEMNTNNSFQEFFDVINSPDEKVEKIPHEENTKKKVFHIKKINIKEVKSTKSKTTINKKPMLLYQYENRHNSILNDNCNKMRNNLKKEIELKKENSTGGFSNCDFRSSQYSSFRFSPQTNNIKLTKKALRVGDVINFYHPSSVEHKATKFKERKINFPLLKKPFRIAPYSCRSSSMDELNAQNEENLLKMRAMAEKRTQNKFNSLSMQLGKIQKNVELIINTTTLNFFSKVNKLMSPKL